MNKEFNLEDPSAPFFDNDATPAPKTGQSRKERETRSKRSNVLFTPTMYAAMQDLAAIKRTSVNGILNDLAADYIDQHQEELDQYRKVLAKFGK